MINQYLIYYHTQILAIFKLKKKNYGGLTSIAATGQTFTHAIQNMHALLDIKLNIIFSIKSFSILGQIGGSTLLFIVVVTPRILQASVMLLQQSYTNKIYLKI